MDFRPDILRSDWGRGGEGNGTLFSCVSVQTRWAEKYKMPCDRKAFAPLKKGAQTGGNRIKLAKFSIQQWWVTP